MDDSVVEEKNIFVNVEVDSFEELIPLISVNLLKSEDVDDNFVDRVLDRERNFPTGLPTEPISVAIPHAYPENVNNNKIVIATLKKPILMKEMGGDSDDNLNVSVVFLLAFNDSNKHLNILQNIVELIKNQDTVNKIFNGDEKTILSAVNKYF